MNIIKCLINHKLITEEQLQSAQLKRKVKGLSLLESILELPEIDVRIICEHIAEVFHTEVINLRDEMIDSTIINLIPREFLKCHNILPFKMDGDDTLEVAMSDPSNILAIDDIQEIISLKIRPIIATPGEIRDKIDECLNQNHFDSVLENITEFSQKKIPLDDDLLHAKCAILNADQSPVVNLINNIIMDANCQKASDIHVEPLEKYVEVRYRIDGILKEILNVPKQVHKHLISRLKIMADLDIAECRRPQDGRIEFKIDEKSLYLRVSIIPTVHGEKIVLRILDSEQTNINIDHLGLKSEDLKKFKSMFKQPQGMILVCGPTGSGKTSTLYAVVKKIKSKEKNIVTIEDPVEQTIEGINQIQVNERTGLTFATGLRTILRQDPNCILVGEIRDQETAEIAFRSSLTGHLVLSTLHTNCSISAITRLKDIGIEPFLICTSLLGIVSQRLIRINCKNCQEPYTPMEILLDKYHHYFAKTNGSTRFIKGHGCRECEFTGYKGRMAIFELLSFDSTVRQLINTNACEETIKNEVRKSGFTTLIEEALSRVAEGLTTIEEVESVIGNYNFDHREQKPSSRNIAPPSYNKIGVNESIKKDLDKFITQLNNLL